MDSDSSVNKLMVLIIMIFIFGGFSIAFTSHPLLKIHPWIRFFGLGLMLLGVFYLYSYFQNIKELKRKQEEEELRSARRPGFGRRRGIPRRGELALEPVPEKAGKGLVLRIMAKLNSSAQKLSIYTFPIVGALIIDAVFIYNFMTGQGLNFESWDTITIMLGVSLIAYNFIPEQFSATRDFMVFFLAILFIILIFPQLFYSIFVGAEASARYTQILLADPVVAMLNTFGIDSSSTVEFRPGGTYTAVISYELVDGGSDKVGITEACSGIYTTSIFISAFITYILIEYQQINLKVSAILALGVITSYIANILRMTIITVVGHYYGTEALLAAHQNAGWLIFLAWIIPFWYLVFKFLIKDNVEAPGSSLPA